MYRHYVVHPQTATDPALAACAAGLQGKFDKMEELIWEKAYKAGRDLSAGKMKQLAQEAGLDMSKYEADIKGVCAQKIREDQAELARFGARGTPAFFINGRFISGARPFPAFKQVIDEELEKANKRIAQGTPVEKYYDTWVIEKGEKKFDPNQAEKE